MSLFSSKGASDSSSDAIDAESIDEASQEAQPTSDTISSRSSRMGNFIEGVKNGAATIGVIGSMWSPLGGPVADYHPPTAIDNQAQVSVEAPAETQYSFKDIQSEHTELRQGPSEDQIRHDEQVQEQVKEYNDHNNEMQLDYLADKQVEQNHEDLINSIKSVSMPESEEVPSTPPVEPAPIEVALPVEAVEAPPEAPSDAGGGDGGA